MNEQKVVWRRNQQNEIRFWRGSYKSNNQTRICSRDKLLGFSKAEKKKRCHADNFLASVMAKSMEREHWWGSDKRASEQL